MIKIQFWDGKSKKAETRKEAVRIVKEGLESWMEKGDIIIWLLKEGDKDKPSFACVANEFGEPSDACAVLKEVA